MTMLFASKNACNVGKHWSIFPLTQPAQNHSFYLVLCVKQGNTDSLQTQIQFIQSRKYVSQIGEPCRLEDK